MQPISASSFALRASAALCFTTTLAAIASAQAAQRPVIDRGDESRTISAPARHPEAQPLAEPAASTATAIRADEGSTAIAPLARPFEAMRRKRCDLESERLELSYVDEDDGSTWVRGRGFKARFGPGGATYIPFFGSEAPRNYPLEISLAGVEADGAHVELEPATEVVRNADRFVIHRGVIDEVYDVALDHVEQSFVVRERPAANSLDLFVRISDDYRAIADDDGFELRGESGSVRYGRAFAVAANGVRVALSTEAVSDSLRIHLGPEVLEGARFPLVVDPVISTFDIMASGLDTYEGDISYDASSDQYMIVWEQTFSGADGDVRYEVIDAAGLQFNATIDLSTENWRNPQTANLRAYHQFLCVAQVSNVVGSTGWVVRGRTVGILVGGGVTMGPSFNISSTDQSGDKVLPDVGGDPDPGTSYYCVVWHRTFGSGDTDIHARLVTNTSTLVGTGTILVDNTGGTLNSWPSISKTDGPLGFDAAWTIAWHRLNATHDVYGARLSWTGAILNPSTLIASSPNDDYFPRVSTPLLDGTVAVVYARNLGTNHDIYYLTLAGMTTLASGNLSALDAPSALSLDQVEYSIDSDGTRLAMAYTQNSVASPGNYDTFVTSFVPFNGNDIRVVEAHVPVDTTTAQSAHTDIVSKWSCGGPAQRFRMIWDNNAYTGGPHVIYAADYDRPIGGSTQAYCLGDGTGVACPCGNTGASGHGCANSANVLGAQLSTTGTPQTGAGDTIQFTALTLPPFTPCLLFQGTTGSNGARFGNGILCAGGTLTRLSIKVASVVGTTQWPAGAEPSISSSTLIPPLGADLWYQVYYRDAASFCTNAAFNLSNGVRILWLP